jgi:hypothetical protein
MLASMTDGGPGRWAVVALDYFWKQAIARRAALA